MWSNKNVAYYSQVRIIGFDNCIGSIHINDLVNPYDDHNRPKKGAIFDAVILFEKFDNKLQRKVWRLTMDTTNAKDEIGQEETEMSKAIKKLNLGINDL